MEDYTEDNDTLGNAIGMITTGIICIMSILYILVTILGA